MYLKNSWIYFDEICSSHNYEIIGYNRNNNFIDKTRITIYFEKKFKCGGGETNYTFNTFFKFCVICLNRLKTLKITR